MIETLLWLVVAVVLLPVLTFLVAKCGTYGYLRAWSLHHKKESETDNGDQNTKET